MTLLSKKSQPQQKMEGKTINIKSGFCVVSRGSFQSENYPVGVQNHTARRAFSCLKSQRFPISWKSPSHSCKIPNLDQRLLKTHNGDQT